MAAQQFIKKLVTQYESAQGKSRADAEVVDTQRRAVRELFKLLDWETNQRASGGESGLVVPERHLRTVASDDRTPPDYSLVVGNVRKCFVGVPVPGVELGETAFHLRRFAWSANAPALIVSNFESLSVYSGRVRPRHNDPVDESRTHHFSSAEYESRWPEIKSLLSLDAVKHGALKRVSEIGVAEPVDDAFLDELERWRKRLAQSIDKTNPSLSVKDLNTVVQLLIDRIVFLRICEDRAIEPYGRLRALAAGRDVFLRLMQWFGEANLKYNAGLFRFERTDSGLDASVLSTALVVEDAVLHEMLKALYAPESPYEFSVVSADILGAVYERFLGNEIVRTQNGVTVEQKPEVRKSGGVFYTPSHVVERIVESTVDKLCEGKTPDEVAQLRVLDPSCGSGSFLNAAYQHLLDWHKNYYIRHGGAKAHARQLRGNAKDGYELTFQERKQILQNNIFGVDIDAQAIEITRLSLLLKVLEGESQGFKREQLVLVRPLPLPDLSRNIVRGNSLIGTDFASHVDDLEPNEREKYQPFDYEAMFPTAFHADRKGFDAVIGNPPYLSYSGKHSVEVPDAVRGYFKQNYSSFQWPAAHPLFMERSVQALSHRYVSFIVPDTVGHLDGYRSLRGVVTEATNLVNVRYWGDNVFKGATTTALTFLCDKTYQGETEIVDRNGSITQTAIRGDNSWIPSRHESILQKASERSFSLDKLVKDCGIMTTRSAEQVVDIAEKMTNDLEVLEGECISRYGCAPPRRAIRLDPSVRMRKSNDGFEKARFLIRQTGSHPIVGPREHALYFRNSLIALHAPDEWPDVRYLVGLLNSRLLRFLYQESIQESKQKAFPQVKIKSLRALPMRNVDANIPEDKAFHDEIVRHVDELLGLNRALSKADEAERPSLERHIQLVDDRIDRLVFRLYGLTREEINIVSNSLEKLSTPSANATAPVETWTSHALWNRIDSGPAAKRWEECLFELVSRDDPGIAPYVADMLGTNNLAPETLSALVIAAETAQSFESDVRQSLKQGLLSAALRLRDASAERPLWAAIRRYASLAPLNEVQALLAFLRDEDSLTTKQATLQAIQNIFSVENPADCLDLQVIRDCVHAIATKAIAAANLAGSAEASFAFQAFGTAASLHDPQIQDLLQLFVRTGRTSLITRAQAVLRQFPRTAS